MRILWISATPDADLRDKLAELCRGARLEHYADAWTAIESARGGSVDVLVASAGVENWTPEEILEECQRSNALMPVIIRDLAGTADDAVRFIKLGAFYYCDGNLAPARLAEIIDAAAEARRTRELALFGSALSQDPWRKFLVGESDAIQAVAHLIRLAGPRRSTVLITGETGTGKEMAARALHMASPRSHLPLVAVNCSALPENLLEAELFGHVKGAFTGAFNQRIGRFEQAHRTTLFLDEIGELPIDLQAKLLRVLQEREFQRLGSSETVRVDVRVIAVSNVDLLDRVRKGTFREDLYYRLNVVPIRMPPLRERLSDIPLLVQHFIDKICRQEDVPPKEIAPETLQRLMRHDWPGNVRQLENVVEMAIALSAERRVLHPGDFPLEPSAAPKRTAINGTRFLALPDEGLDFERTIGQIERDLLHQALERTRGNKKMAADMLGLKRTTLAAKLKILDEEAVNWTSASP